MRLFRAHLDPARRVSFVHVNPVFDSERFAPRALGEALPTIGLRDAEDLLTGIGFARFADGTAPLAELESYLAARVPVLLRRLRDPAAGRVPGGAAGGRGGRAGGRPSHPMSWSLPEPDRAR